MSGEIVKAGEYRERYANNGRTGLINKIEARAVVAGAKATWAPIAS